MTSSRRHRRLLLRVLVAALAPACWPAAARADRSAGGDRDARRDPASMKVCPLPLRVFDRARILDAP